MIPLTKIAEDATTYTLQWDEVPGEDAGFRFRLNDVRKVPHTWDVDRRTVRVAKGYGPYIVEALKVQDTGYYFPDSGSTSFLPPPEWGAVFGAASHDLTDVEHAAAFDKMEELAGGKRFGVRIVASSLTAEVQRDFTACFDRNLTPYCCLGGTDTSPQSVVPSGITDIVAAYVGEDVVYTSINEPDINGWTAQEVADYQVALYDAIKAITEGVPVGYAPLWKGSPNLYENWLPYVQAAIATADGKFDFFPTHNYDDPTNTTSGADGWNMWHWVFSSYGHRTSGTVDILFAAAGIDVPIIVDEGGATAPDYGDEALEAAFVLKLLNTVGDGHNSGMYIYAAVPDAVGYASLLNADLSERQSFAAYRDFLAAL